MENADRVDIVWDKYLRSSIKGFAREKRGKGVRRKVSGSNKIPGKWQEFLQDSDNKQELFAFLSATVALTNFPNGKTVVITSAEHVIVKGHNVGMAKTDHEEADTRIALHLLNALLRGSTTCLIRTVDTDVVVILIGIFAKLTAICQMANIWVAFGTGKNFTYYHVNDIATTIGAEKYVFLPVFQFHWL